MCEFLSDVKNSDIKLVFAPYKIKNLFSVKDAILKTLRSLVVYKCSCAGCNACYVGETNRHLATRVREHLTSDKNLHVFQLINMSETCKALCSEDCFSILDIASTSFQLKIKEALHIGWGKPLLNKLVRQSRQSITFILIVLVNFTFLIFFLAFSTPLYFSYSLMSLFSNYYSMCIVFISHRLSV